ncbi:hypothetical protein OKW34_006371 [Paraburkholderia youngii]
MSSHILPPPPFTIVREPSLRSVQDHDGVMASGMRGSFAASALRSPRVETATQVRAAGDFGKPSVKHSFSASRQCGAASPNTRASLSFDILELAGRLAGVG